MERESDELIFRQVWADCWKSLFFFGTLLACIIFVGSFSRWLGLVLFSIFAVVTLRDILRLLFAVGLGVLVLPFTLMAALKMVPVSDSRLRGDEVYLLNANAIVVMQLFVLVTYNLFLYNYFFITANVQPGSILP
jgi:hypothetical protein